MNKETLKKANYFLDRIKQLEEDISDLEYMAEASKKIEISGASHRVYLDEYNSEATIKLIINNYRNLLEKYKKDFDNL